MSVSVSARMRSSIGSMVAGVVDALEHRHRVAGDLADHVLEQLPGAEEQLQRPGDPLLEQDGIGVLRRPRRPASPTRRTSFIVEKRLSSSVMSRLASPG